MNPQIVKAYNYLKKSVAPFFMSIVIVLAVVIPCLSQTEADEENNSGKTKTEADSKQRPILGRENVWERIVSLPGDIIYLPLYLLFGASQETIRYFYESKIVPRAVDFLTADDGSWGLPPVYSSRSGGGK